MADALRACIWNTVPDASGMLRDALGKLSGVEVTGEIGAWADLRHALDHNVVDVVVVYLDDEDGQAASVVERVAEVGGDCRIVGISAQTDPSSILKAMRSGCNQYVCAPIDADDLSDAMGRIRAGMSTRHHTSKRVCVIGSAGGSGATTIACNLAVELGHITDRPCALVDLNLEFGDVAAMFDASVKYSIADVCREGMVVDYQVLQSALHELACNVSLLARPERVEDAREVAPEGVQSALQVLGEMFPYVVVDLPRMFSFFNVAALQDADHVFIIAQLSVPHICNAKRIFDCLCQMGTEPQNVDIVLNRCKANFATVSPDDVESQFGRPVFAMIPNDYRRIQSSLDLGNPVMNEGPNSAVRTAIQQMANQIATGQTGAPAPVAAGPGNGIFSKLWRRTAKSDS